MIHFILEELAHLLLGAIIVTFIAFLASFSFVKFSFNWESIKRLYPASILFLMFMLFLNIIHIGFLGFFGIDEEIIEILEIGSFFIIVAIAVYIGRNLSKEYILLQVNRELEARLEERTKELKESEEKYRQSVDMAGDAILAVDLDTGMILDANKKAEEFLGYDNNEFLNNKIWRIFLEKDRKKLKEEYSQTKVGLSASGEFQVMSKDGTMKPVLCVWSLIKYRNKKFAQMIMTDISQRKKLEKELEKRSKSLLYQTTKLENLYYSVKVLSSVTNAKLFIEKLLGLAKKMTRARYAAFATFGKGGKIKDFITSGISKEVIDAIESRPEWSGLISAMKGSKSPLRVDDISKHPESCGFPLNHPEMKTVLGVSLISSKGNAIGVLFIAEKKGGPFMQEDEDIITTLSTEAATFLERINLLNHISKSRSEWQKTFDSISDFVVIHDNNHHIVRVNKPLQAKLGLPYDEIKGEACKILEGIFYEKVKGCPHDEVIRVKSHAVDEVVGSKGEAFFVSSYPLADKKGKISSTIHVARDISVYRHLAEVEEEMKRLDELNRFKSQFVSTVAHELRTPLTSLQGFVELLLTRETDAEAQEKWIKIIHEEAQLLGQLVSEVLDLSQIEEGRLRLKRESLSIDAIMRKEVERFSLRNYKHTFRKEIQGSLGKVYGDKDKIVQVLTNLMENASKYSPEGEEIIVRAVEEDDMVKVSVSDRGSGIPEWEIEKIFEPFYRAEMPDTVDVKGTGLGLAISKAIVEMHGGELWVESEKGNGSTFCFTLPLEFMKNMESKEHHFKKEQSGVGREELI